MQFSTDDIIHISSDIWASTLGFQIRHIPGNVEIPPTVRSMIGCIQIAGDWQGAVTLYCPKTLARKATAAMFGMPEADVGEAEIRDTLGELTNMTAGNIKTFLPASCLISLPSVAEGTDYKLTVPGGKIVAQTCFVCEGEPLLVNVLERE